MESTPNSQTPLVSVLCVSRNQDHNLRRCLVALSRSTLAAQTQVVVVDLASHDETATVVADFSELTALRLPKNFGWTKAANIGLRSTTAENILFLDPCVELDPGTVEVLLSSVAESGTVAAAVATLRTTDGSPASYLRPLPVATLLRMEAHAPAQPEESESVDYPGLAALLIRKSFLKGMNYFDERYGELWSDAELAAQVKRAQRRILRLPGAGGVLHPEQDKRIPSALLAADWHSGAAVYLKKHYGLSLGRSLGPIVRSLLSGNLSLARHLLAGDKVDGTQE
ncbi:MAG: glycosyltransferase family 2 protein [Acidobacteriota bacterium]|jgi:GT2 family glycosyltransferase